MSDKELRLQVVFAALDKLTAPMKKIVNESTVLGKAIKATDARLQELHAQQKKVGQFQDLKSGLKATGLELRNAQQNAKAIGSQLASLCAQATPAADAIKKLGVEQRKADAVVKKLSDTYRANLERNREMRASLLESGISTKRLGEAQAWLKGTIALTNVELSSQQKRLAGLGAQQQAYQQRVTKAQDHAGKARNVAGHLATAGIGATVAGGVIGAPIVKGVQEAKHYQTETARVRALGLGDKASGEAIQFARDMKTFGTSQNENLELMRDGMTIFADVHHAEMSAPILAKMKFANRAMFGQEGGAENDRMFMDLLKVVEMRGGASNEASMRSEANYVQQVITATGGRVAPEHWKQFIQRGGVAAKVLDDKAFYYQQEPLIQEMGGATAGVGLQSAYQNLYQGKTTARAGKFAESLGLLDPSKVMYNKIGDLKGFMPGALKSGDQFTSNPLEWLEKTLLPALAKKGITKEKEVIDSLGTLFSNRTAANYYAQMYKQRDQIHKNIKLNTGADNVDSLEAKARNTAGGREMEAGAKLSDLKLVMGEKILPLYTDALIVATKALKGLSEFMERNPAMAKAMIVGFSVIAGLLVVLGPLMLGIAALIGPYAILHVMFAKMGVAGGVLMPILRGIAIGFTALGKAVFLAGRLMLTNPIVLIITAIALAAYLIYKHWEPIKAWFSALWSGITTMVSAAVQSITDFLMNWTIVGFVADHWNDIKAITVAIWALIKGGISNAAQGIMDFLMSWPVVAVIARHWDSISAGAATAWQWIKDRAVGAGQGIADFFMNWSLLGIIVRNWDSVTTFMSGLVGRFTALGGNMMDGLSTGFMDGLHKLKNAVNSVGESAIGWFKEKLGIHSPSRAFAELGDYTMQGLAIGLQRSEDGPVGQVGSLAKRLTQLGAGIAIGAATMPAMAFDTRPPIAPRAAGSSAAVQGDTIQIIIQPAAGMDAQAIARAVAQELDKRDRQKAARRRSGLSDYHE
ncbi:phage tail tape measure protein [Collimonas fungivorans]|uniref:Putative phage-related tail transmembrane protein n=1 Tax=Collimonas fungivorans (strain Ter331) TaxID=1005048 RepID=G0AIR6_COLFT|nr:phage-related tail protein [Collimonas fungivorans]AEK60849.1 putative phage-related tail transmembrane protein [Collimonas fungivorans Ter331]